MSSIPARHNRRWQSTLAPVRRGLTWLGCKPETARPRRRWLLPAAFVATALAAGTGGYLLHSTGASAANVASTAANPTGAGTGTQTGSQALDAKSVFDRLVAAGLPMTSPIPVDKSTDPDKLLGTKGGYTSRLSFSLPGGNPNADQYGIGRGGVIEVFANAGDANKHAGRVRKDERIYRAGPVLVLLAGNIDRALADKVRAAVAGLEKQA